MNITQHDPVLSGMCPDDEACKNCGERECICGDDHSADSSKKVEKKYRPWTVRDIILAHLRSFGADGLCCEGCGCGIEKFNCECVDLITCVPARKTIATEAGEYWEIGDEIFVPMEKEDEE